MQKCAKFAGADTLTFHEKAKTGKYNDASKSSENPPLK